MLSLQYAYAKEYEKGLEYSKKSIDVLHTNTSINADYLTAAQKFTSWYSFKYQSIRPGDTAYLSSFLPQFLISVKHFEMNQLSHYSATRKWLKDGYRSSPLLDLLPTLRYIYPESPEKYSEAISRAAFHRYPGTKFHLIERSVGDSFNFLLNSYIDNWRLDKQHQERDLLLIRNAWPDIIIPDSIASQTSNQTFLNLINGDFNPDLKGIQNSLKDGEAYIRYINEQHAHQELITFVVITKNNIEFQPIEIGLIDICFYEFNEWQDSRGDYTYAFSSMKEKIWSPIQSILEEQHISTVKIEMSGRLAGFPFEVFEWHEPNPISIEYTLGIEIDALLNKVERTAQNGFCAFQPNYFENPLPATNALSNQLAQNHGTLLPSDLKSKDLLDAITSYKIVHIGSHGSAAQNGFLPYHDLSKQLADSTFIFLENERISLNQLNDLELNTDLVVLAACESGYGVINHGEGKIDFTRAIIQAGAKGVIIGLWKLDDYATAKILSEFYRLLAKGETCVAALRQAKNHFLNTETDPEYQNPKYWAGIIYMGEDQKIDLPKKSGNKLWWLSLLMIPIVVVVILKIRR